MTISFRRTAAAAVGAMLASAATLAAAAETPAIDPATLDKAFAGLAQYDLGKDREPLATIERLARQSPAGSDLHRRIEQGLVRALQGNLSDEARYFACRQLWILGTDDALAVLAGLLADEKSAHMACYAIGNSPSPKAASVLRQALGQARGKALLSVIALVGERRDQGAVEPLIGYLSSGDPLVAEAAAAALGKIATPEAAAALAKARSAAAASLRPAFTAAIIEAADRLAAAGRTDLATPIFKELMAATETRQVRRAAFLGLVAMGGAQAVPLILQTMRSDEGRMRATAIACIRTVRGEKVVEQFAAEMPKLPPAEQALLISALADRPEPAVRTVIVQAASSTSAEVRTAAAGALGRIGDAAAVLILARALAQGDDAEKQAAGAALRILKGAGVDGAIVECMVAAKGQAKAALIAVIQDRGMAQATDALLKAASDADEMVRAAAMRALAALAQPQHLSAIISMLVNMTDDAGRAEAEAAAIAVARRIADESARTDAVIAAMGGTGQAARCSLLRVLRGIATAKALETILAALKDSDPQVQDAAVRALADWPDGRATQPLLQFVKTTASQTHRVVAMRGAVRLLGQSAVATAESLRAYKDLMALAPRPEDKKMILAALARAAHPESLSLIGPCLEDPATAAEASLAAIEVARAIAGSHPQEAGAALGRLAKVARDDVIRKEAEALKGRIDKLGDWLTSWLVAGPYMEEGKDHARLFDTVFPPEQAQAADVPWRILPLGSEGFGGTIFFELDKILGPGENRVAYLRTWIYSPAAQDAQLQFGFDDGGKVWLNGKVVCAANTAGACVPGAHKADVQLKAGWNLLAVKVTQATGPWQFCGRITGRDGGPMKGLKQDCLHEP